MTPLQLYQQQLTQGDWDPNAEQLEVITYLNQIYLQLCQRHHLRHTRLQQMRDWLRPPSSIVGLYLWGNVGVGKTHLINLFYQSLPIPKIRQHFHAFMQGIQQQLTQHQGIKNPLQFIAKNIAHQNSVLVLDEFFVENIADAMILAELLRHLFKNGVTLITTSNTEPDQLYGNGLQREHFLPAIDIIKQHTWVKHIRIEQDYRQRTAQPIRAYYSPLNDHTAQLLKLCFSQLTGNLHNQQPLELFNRVIPVKNQANGVIWFDFSTICGRPRGTPDYIALSQRYHTILISDIPALHTVPIDELLSFIYLIDILYDEHIRLIISAEVPIGELYPTGRLRQRFERTESRLIEMQSPAYFNRT